MRSFSLKYYAASGLKEGKAYIKLRAFFSGPFKKFGLKLVQFAMTFPLIFEVRARPLGPVALFGFKFVYILLSGYVSLKPGPSSSDFLRMATLNVRSLPSKCACFSDLVLSVM